MWTWGGAFSLIKPQTIFSTLPILPRIHFPPSVVGRAQYVPPLITTLRIGILFADKENGHINNVLSNPGNGHSLLQIHFALPTATSGGNRCGRRIHLRQLHRQHLLLRQRHVHLVRHRPHAQDSPGEGRLKMKGFETWAHGIPHNGPRITRQLILYFHRQRVPCAFQILLQILLQIGEMVKTCPHTH